ncbi:FadR/GntR family transcriptional regulator [Thermomonospora cellulosilytica]|uniref:DNA-binding FadR family transcriptional regulator n=1 Tax=Thermomonospora cellulosilytica TaxID=1411118 RepID=A0A7W3MUD0_9ACTN|nr:FadR/GntR family transcriptional regulator [Thermomonospora cellulosilytica]MBA9002076.1 DNA-binding FadR family transcriptional regulator [Thermomonospora cellulosilytica]
MTLRTARRSSLVDQVIDQLKGEIATGAWAVGTKIPPEPVLSEMLGVGRNTVREAVRALTHAGLLECRQGDGTYVRATSELSGVMRRRLRAAELLEILEVRRGLETEAARLAAARRTEADVAAIRRALRRCEERLAAGDRAGFVEADLAFHTAVVEATHNRVLVDLYGDFSEALRAAITTAADLLDHVEVPHAPIADAVAEGDAEAAERATQSCLEAVIRSIGGLPSG